MRRYIGDISPPPGKWPCERPIVHVLNGDYPEAALKRMSAPGLERLVAKLVQCTTKTASRPKWWPPGLDFNHPLDLGLSSEREIRDVIVSCCQFFKGRAGDENRRRGRRKRLLPSPSKHQFLRYFRLNAKRDKVSEAVAPPAAAGAAKLTTCIHIPFSSDVGRVMAAREHHGLTEELKMRRLERSEWYTNRAAPRTGEAEYEAGAVKEVGYSHVYKMPKRQQHQRRPAFRSVEFLARFCTPVSVALQRLDLDKLRKEVKRRELVVVIRDTERMSCDLRTDAKVRSSPRLRNV